ncbi:MAG: type II toxin-antitoxin system VapC family toxin [Actinomycetota bacterium]
MHYLDSSAIVKLIAREPETAALVEGVRTDQDVVSSELAVTEVIRAVARVGGGTTRAASVLNALALVPIDGAILRDAASLKPRSLRTLDAIHLATALSLGRDLDVLITYDQRLGEAAERAGLTVSSPGA